MIHISASSIKDWLACSKRYVYRTQYPKEDAEKTPDLLVGTAVHEIIENHWNDSLDNNLKRLSTSLASVGLTEENKYHITKAERSIKNFYRTYIELLGDDDEVEKSFKIQIKPNVFLVGKIDRIIPKFGGIVIDWKTNNKAPKEEDLEKDVQFIIYRQAYKHLYKKDPAKIWYASLFTNDRLLVQYNSIYHAHLFDEIIPKMVSDIEHNSYIKQGLYTGACGKCQFKKICIGD